MVTEADKEAAANEPCEFDDTLNSIGANGEYWAKRLKQLSTAMETKAQIPKGASEFVYSKKMKAWDVRVKAQDIAHRLRGDYKAAKHELLGPSGGPVEISVVKEKLREALEQSEKAKE